MRWSLLLLLVAIPTLAFAEPKVAVAPLDGDGDDGKVADIVADAAGERAKVTKQGRTEGAMRSLGVSVLSAKSVKKLRNKLDVDVVIYGTVEKDGGEKRLSLQLAGSGKSKLELSYKSEKQLRKELAAKLPKKIGAAMAGTDGDAEAEAEEEERRARREKEEEERRAREKEEERRAERARKEEEDRRKKQEEEDRRKKQEEEDERRASRKKKDKKRVADRDEDDEDGDRRKKRVADRDEDDEDRDRRKKRVADRDDEDSRDDEGEDDDEDRPRKKRRRGEERRHVLTQAALWLDAGAAFARRTLTYQATGMMQPPGVGTAAPAGRLEGEVYPAAFSTLKGAAAGIGLVGAYSRTFALGIAVPGTQVIVPIQNGHYSIGGRYRIVFGEHSVAFGLSYWRTWYKADRTKLMMPTQLDMPDVDYSAIAPGVAARIGITPKVSAFGSLDVPLMLYSGPIQDPTTGYGASKILAIDFRAGAQIVLATHVALELGLDFEQIGLTFTGQQGSMAATRMVSKATDRSIGVAATLGINY